LFHPGTLRFNFNEKRLCIPASVDNARCFQHCRERVHRPFGAPKELALQGRPGGMRAAARVAPLPSPPTCAILKTTFSIGPPSADMKRAAEVRTWSNN
jgi:hypothetical protein